MHSIGECAQITSLSIHTLRYYEQEGLLHPRRDDVNRRQYSEEDLAWIAFLRRLKATGMPLKEIEKYAGMRAQGDDTLEARLALLGVHRKELEGRIRDLQENLEALDQKIAWYKDRSAENKKSGTD